MGKHHESRDAGELRGSVLECGSPLPLWNIKAQRRRLAVADPKPPVRRDVALRVGQVALHDGEQHLRVLERLMEHDSQSIGLQHQRAQQSKSRALA